MKLKTQEKIRLAELIAMFGITGLINYLSQYLDASIAKELSQMLISKGISLEEINEIIQSIYILDYCTNFRTQRFTEEYKQIESNYKFIIKNTCQLYQRLGISDSPIKIFATYVYMYRSGYFSYNNNFEYSIDMKDFAGLTGVDVIRGTGVCRSISSMLTDIYRELGYKSYNLSVRASSESIANLQKLSSISLKKSDKGKKFAKIVGKVTDKLPIANHLITMVRTNDKNYVFDPTNDGFLYKDRRNKIITFTDQSAIMNNYFFESFMINLLGMYNDGVHISNQIKQLNMPTVGNKTYRKEYLEALQLCIDNEKIFIEFYNTNKELIDNIYNISKNQSGMVRRLIPIIPNIKGNNK